MRKKWAWRSIFDTGVLVWEAWWRARLCMLGFGISLSHVK
jgi:hypothetical protein